MQEEHYGAGNQRRAMDMINRNLPDIALHSDKQDAMVIQLINP
jgi:hypothetical protein